MFIHQKFCVYMDVFVYIYKYVYMCIDLYLYVYIFTYICSFCVYTIISLYIDL